MGGVVYRGVVCQTASDMCDASNTPLAQDTAKAPYATHHLLLRVHSYAERERERVGAKPSSLTPTPSHHLCSLHLSHSLSLHPKMPFSPRPYHTHIDLCSPSVYYPIHKYWAYNLLVIVTLHLNEISFNVMHDLD